MRATDAEEAAARLLGAAVGIEVVSAHGVLQAQVSGVGVDDFHVFGVRGTNSTGGLAPERVGGIKS